MKLYGMYKEWNYPEEQPECGFPVWKEYIIKDLYKRKLAKAIWHDIFDREIEVEDLYGNHYSVHLRDDNDVDIVKKIENPTGYTYFPLGTCSVKDVYRYICGDENKINDNLTVSMWDIEISHHSEFGKVFKWRCPECGRELRYYEGASFANELDCDCGLHWELVFFAQGREKELE